MCAAPPVSELVLAAGDKPGYFVLRCPFAGDGADQALVFDRNANGLPDFESDAWVFDSGGDGRANLIVEFNTHGGSAVARLYDDQTGDGQVSYSVERGTFTVVETPYPTVQLTTVKGGWLQEGRINFNLDIVVDGPVVAAFSTNAYFDRLKSDGRPDFEHHVRDLDDDGRPDYHLVQATPDVPESWGILRTELMVNTADDETPISGALLWPYLGTAYGPPPDLPDAPEVARPAGVRSDFVKDYGWSFPPIQMYWPASRIVYVGEFVASRGNEHNYFVYSTRRFGIEGKTYANFENPFSFYDLANDDDGYPELEVRMQYDSAEDLRAQGLPGYGPVQLIRYSWDQGNARRWDYKLDLVGQHAIESVVRFPEFGVETVPYADYPRWVTDKTWEAASLVAVEQPAYWSSEGIYEGLNVTEDAWKNLVPGVTDRVTDLDEDGWPVGFRGEYRIAPGAKAELYFSPIDGKLHLLKAQAGVWNLSEARRLRYASLGGEYINQWLLEQDGVVEKGLYALPEWMLYHDSNGVSLAAVPAPGALFTTLPPRDHAEWKWLGEHLAAHAPSFAPDDFAAMFRRFSRSPWQVSGATARALRVTLDGFRFVLTLQPGFTVRGSGGTDLAGLAAGEYVVVYNGAFRVLPLTPARLTLARPEVSAATLTALNPVKVSAVVHNPGLEDAPPLPLELTAERLDVADTQPVALGVMTATVVAGAVVPVEWRWTPPSAGEWRLSVAPLTPQPEAPVSPVETTLFVNAAPFPLVNELLPLGQPAGWLAVTLLVVAAVAALFVNRIVRQ
jgi:hypothetical protein